MLATTFACVVFLPERSFGDPKHYFATIVTNVPLGISLEELARRTGIKPTHLVSARVETNSFLAVSLSFSQPSGTLNFLFENEKLRAIQDRPKVEFETKTHRGKPWKVPKAFDSEDRFNQIANAPNLTPLEIESRFQQWAKNQNAATQGSELNILPAARIVAATSPTAKTAQLHAETQAAELAEKYNPFKIALGMTPSEVKALFGTPALQQNLSNGSQLHVYGEQLSGLVPAHIPYVWVSIVFCEGIVTRVFSHDLFDKRLIPPNASQ